MRSTKPERSGRRMGRRHRLRDTDPLRFHLVGTQGLHRRPRRPLVPGQAQRKGRIGVRVHLFAPRWQRIHSPLNLHPNGTPWTYHRALGYADPAMFKAGTPYGATHVSARDSLKPDDDHLAVARFQGRRVTSVARGLLHTKIAGAAA